MPAGAAQLKAGDAFAIVKLNCKLAVPPLVVLEMTTVFE